MKRRMIFILLLVFLFNTNVYADMDVLDMCSNPEPLQVLLFVKYVINIIKIVVPLALIIFGSIDFIKVIVNKSEELNKTLIVLVKRVLAGIIIFFIPSIISVVLSLVNEDFEMCETNLTQEKINELKEQLILEENRED